MMNSRLLLLTIFCIVAIQTSSFSQNAKKSLVDAKVQMLDGQVVDCQVNLPIGNYADSAFKNIHKNLFIVDGDNNEVKIPADDVDFLVLYTDEMQTLIKRTQYYTYSLKGKSKLSNEKYWVQLRSGCEPLSSYVALGQFDITRKGTFYEEYIDGMTSYMLQRSGEDYPTFVGVVFLRSPITQKSFDKQRNNMLEHYFSNDSKALSALVEGKKHTTQAQLKEYIDAQCNQ